MEWRDAIGTKAARPHVSDWALQPSNPKIDHRMNTAHSPAGCPPGLASMRLGVGYDGRTRAIPARLRAAGGPLSLNGLVVVVVCHGPWRNAWTVFLFGNTSFRTEGRHVSPTWALLTLTNRRSGGHQDSLQIQSPF